MKENLKGLPLDLLTEKIKSLGHPTFRARQLFRWIYQERKTQFVDMTDLSKNFRSDLAERFTLSSLKVAHTQNSSDGTIKYLVQLDDGERVETVFIPSEDRTTLCISTQVGCKMGCRFCATATQGFTRNLSSAEIIDQYLLIPSPRPITNIVLMGMGEPLDNELHVYHALKILNDPLGPKIGKRHITLSTVGLTSKINKFVESNVGNLAISLHGTTEEQREAIMPINRKYPIDELMEVCRGLKFKGRRRVTFEYLLIKDFNDSSEDAHRLAELVRGISCKINLLSYNENPLMPFQRPLEEQVLNFQKILLSYCLTATYRRSRGQDIDAACGQLRTREGLGYKNVLVSQSPQSL